MKKNRTMTLLLVGPTFLWMFAFLVLPLIYSVAMSFAEKGLYGGVLWAFHPENYLELWNVNYLQVTLRSFRLAFLTSVICLFISYPFAVILTKVTKKWSGFLLLLIMLPFWINGLIRLNGWANILRDTGLINRLLLALHIIDKPLTLLYTEGAVLFGMVYAFFPFMILPIHTSLSKLDSSLLEAAGDLGANPYRTFRRVTIPLTIPGIFAGMIQVFIPSLGAFYISDIMGGGNSIYLGNLIKNQFLSARNWPLGAAFSVLLIVLTLFIMKIYSQIGSVEDMA